MGNDSDDRDPHLPLPVVRSEEDILSLALAVAAKKGDPTPELIQHTTGTREATTKTTGSWVRSDQPSYLIAMRGHFSAPRARPPRLTTEPENVEDQFVSYSVQVLVVDIQTGRITDSGGSNEYPDLASGGPVVTDSEPS